jgi:rhodanese-related sulfurtransferase
MFKNLNSEEFQEKLKQDPNGVLLDVRTPDEYNNEHIPNSINIDIHNSDFFDKIDELELDKNYYIYCRSGSRSARACQLMASQGFDGALYNLQGGILDWSGERES